MCETNPLNLQFAHENDCEEGSERDIDGKVGYSLHIKNRFFNHFQKLMPKVQHQEVEKIFIVFYSHKFYNFILQNYTPLCHLWTGLL